MTPPERKQKETILQRNLALITYRYLFDAAKSCMCYTKHCRWNVRNKKQARSTFLHILLPWGKKKWYKQNKNEQKILTIIGAWPTRTSAEKLGRSLKVRFWSSTCSKLGPTHTVRTKIVGNIEAQVCWSLESDTRALWLREWKTTDAHLGTPCRMTGTRWEIIESQVLHRIWNLPQCQVKQSIKHISVIDTCHHLHKRAKAANPATGKKTKTTVPEKKGTRQRCDWRHDVQMPSVIQAYIADTHTHKEAHCIKL